jgi:hypothetical protein
VCVDATGFDAGAADSDQPEMGTPSGPTSVPSTKIRSGLFGTLAAIAADETAAYLVLVSSDASTAGDLVRVAADGSSAQTLASAVEANNLLVAGGTVYWYGKNGIGAVQTDGTNQRILATPSPGPSAFAVDGNRVFWATSTSSTYAQDARIESIADEAGSVTETLATSLGFMTAMWVGNGTIYMSELGVDGTSRWNGFERLDESGGVPHEIAGGSSLASVPLCTATVSIASDGAYYFCQSNVTHPNDGGVYHMGLDGSARQLSSPSIQVIDIEAAPSYVFVSTTTDFSSSTVVAFPVASASAPVECGGYAGLGRFAAASDDTVYWLDGTDLYRAQP